MDIDIRRLSPDQTEAYLHFFDTVPHSDQQAAHRCYCVCWSDDAFGSQDFSTAEKRRAIAADYVRGGHIQGYLAYADDEAVGWCNANTKADCLKCLSWKRFMQAMPTDDVGQGRKVKSVFCFTVAPSMKRKGIAGQLLERVCQDAAKEGFDYVEAYPNKAFINDEEDFMGPITLFEKHGFVIHAETEDKYVMRKSLG